MITIKNLSKSYGSQVLFQNVNLRIGDNEKIGLLGRNGSGKSTFLKMLLERDDTDGAIHIPDTVIMSALEQHLNFQHDTLLAQVCASLPKYAIHNDWQAKSLLMGLGFRETDFDKAPKSFSSGYQIRIRLAEALIKEPHLLLLDEPTNYLDILSLRWLARFLQQWKSAFILVTHDRHFMEQVVTHTIGIHRGEMRKMKGGPQKLMDQIEKEEEVYEKTRVNQEKKRKKTEEFIRNFRSGARSAGLVQSRIKSLEKQEVKEKLSAIPQIHFQFRSVPFQGDSPLKVHNIGFGYNEGPLFEKCSFVVNPGDRIAVIGRNGKGKSTLLKVLAAKLQPQQGSVRPHVNLMPAFFSTDGLKELSAQKTILEELRSLAAVKEQALRNLCGALLFTGDASHKKISQLSGGEKSRVCLGKAMLTHSNILFLDEPTNHLDMESCQALIESLLNYPGSIVFVSHDEDMISQVANRLIVFDKGNIQVLEHGYEEFLALQGWSEEEEEGLFKAVKARSENKKEYLQRKEDKKRLRVIEKRLQILNKELDTLSEQQSTVATQLEQAYAEKNTAHMEKYGKKLKDIGDTMDAALDEMEQLMDEQMRLEELID